MKIDSSTLLIAGVAVVGVYLLTRPKTPTYPVGYNPYAGTAGLPTGYNPYAIQQQGSTTAQDIAAGGTALEGLANIIGNFF